MCFLLIQNQPPDRFPNSIFIVTSVPLTMARKRHTIAEKLRILSDAEARLALGESMRSIARSYNLQGGQIRDWKKKHVKLASFKRTKKSLARGAKSCLAPFEDKIMTWAMQLQDAGVPLQYRHLMIKTGEIWPAFRQLSHSQQYTSIRLLCKRNFFNIRRITHTGQENPNDRALQADQWLDVIRPIVRAPGVNKKFVLNMDQTPMFLTMLPSTSLHFQGDHTVNGRCTSNSGCRFTVSVTISANSDKLMPYVIFKGEPNGRISTRKFPVMESRNRVVLCCQSKAWQNETNMLDYIDKVLAPYLQEMAVGAPCYLFLDHFSAHWTTPVQDKLIQLGITPYKIPAGCTSLVQPVDVGIGKPFKDCVRSKWWDWMRAQGANRSTFVSASRDVAATWVADSWSTIPTAVVKNAWKKTGFKYFDD